MQFSEAGVTVLFTPNGSEEQSVNLHSISLQSELCVIGGRDIVMDVPSRDTF